MQLQDGIIERGRLGFIRYLQYRFRLFIERGLEWKRDWNSFQHKHFDACNACRELRIRNLQIGYKLIICTFLSLPLAFVLHWTWLLFSLGLFLFGLGMCGRLTPHEKRFVDRYGSIKEGTENDKG